MSNLDKWRGFVGVYLSVSLTRSSYSSIPVYLPVHAPQPDSEPVVYWLLGLLPAGLPAGPADNHAYRLSGGWLHMKEFRFSDDGTARARSPSRHGPTPWPPRHGPHGFTSLVMLLCPRTVSLCDAPIMHGLFGM